LAYGILAVIMVRLMLAAIRHGPDRSSVRGPAADAAPVRGAYVPLPAE
jgi:hypothetical protein